ncbi:NAD(P)/FAD-dependent oxidoreductase [Chitinophaga japonensis]|uniref:Glycine/D-amino acid oxidase-like deaminating enzyme n=1 Tax=Chitinophaga japonensis TaxID=104662 RepID=A0A562T4I8_CHIJA|nr:FAD-dependent oxidoreductase [Chitinophaga japonensis]TWI88422.1 glycine/D-amino acid oxidase-like deaminating enzyme [Chitinophaga japonensis]
MLSYWEKQSFLHYDYIVLGSGITGLSTAISIRQRRPGARVLVLERGLLPTGASTRNAGFACIGSLTEILADLRSSTPAEVAALVAMRRKGLQLLRQRLGDSHIDYREQGSYELISRQELPALQQLDAANALLQPVLGGEAFTQVNEKIRSFGFHPQYTAALVQNNYEGELDTGKMMRRLTDLAIAQQVEIKTGCLVTRFEETRTGVNVIAQTSAVQEEVIFHCQRLAVCTNAFTKTLLPDIDLQPGRGQVLITDPVPGLPFTGIFHMEEGYYYFRELQGRVLFGGGRHLDFAGEATTAFELNAHIQQQLEEKLRTIILPHHPFTVADRWTGIMAFGASKQPLLQAWSEKIFLGLRLGGMGVAIGSAVGEELAAMLTKHN